MSKQKLTKKYVRHFYRVTYQQLYTAILNKFKEIFSSYLSDVEDKHIEDLCNLFWTEVVEPGWQPDVLKDFYAQVELMSQETDEEIETYNFIGDYFVLIEKAVCIELGLPIETVEL